MKSFRISYLNPDNCEEEICFKIYESEALQMFNELVMLFNTYCYDTYRDDPCWITGVEEMVELVH